MDDSFSERERQFEAKFAHDDAPKFRIVAHRNRLFAAWIVDQMGDWASPGYADCFTAHALDRSPEALIERAQQDLHDHGVALADVKLHKAFARMADQAQAEVMNA